MKISDLPDFTKLHNFCQTHYPKDIWDNVDVLYWLVWPRRPNAHEKALKRFKATVAGRYLLEYHLAKSITRSIDKPWPKRAKSSVLVPIPNRKHHLALIFPVTNILCKQGVPVTILFPHLKDVRTLSPNPFHGASLLAMEDIRLFPRRYRVARTHYSKLKPAVEDLCIRLELGKNQVLATKRFFQAYCMDKVLFKVVLKETQPALLYGFQYVANRGYLAAIEEEKAEGRQLTNLLIQHGVFFKNGFHYFGGADHVFLWGKYFETALQSSIASIPIPPSSVIGNPKLEVQFNRLQAKREAKSRGEKKTILFASIPDTPFSGGGNAKALQLFAGAVSRLEQWQTIYKLHPREDFENYRSLIRNGLIEPGQVVKDVSVYDLINIADVVVGTTTTVLPEVIALGKPALQLLPGLWQTDWTQYGLLAVSSEEELLRELHHILGCQAYSEVVLQKERQLSEAMFGKIEGTSVRIARYLMDRVQGVASEERPRNLS